MPEVTYIFFEPLWIQLQKIRIVMGKRDSRYKLTEFIEIDEGFFETINTDNHKDTKIKRGRGSQKQAKVLVLIESTPVIEKLKKDKHKPDRMPGHIKMIVMSNLKANTINEQVKINVDPETTIISDGYITSRTTLMSIVINTTEGILENKYSTDFLLHVLKIVNL